MAKKEISGSSSEKREEVVKRLMELIRDAGLQKLKWDLTRLEFDGNKGILGKKLNVLEEMVGKFKSPKEVTPSDLTRAGKLYHEILLGKKEFGEARDKVDDQGSLVLFWKEREKEGGEDYGKERQKSLRINGETINSKNRQIDDLGGVEDEVFGKKVKEARELAFDNGSISVKRVYELEGRADSRMDTISNKIKEIEDGNKALKGKSGLFLGGVDEVLGKIADQERVMESLSDERQILSCLDEIYEIRLKSAKQLGTRDLIDINGKIEELERKHVRVIRDRRRIERGLSSNTAAMADSEWEEYQRKMEISADEYSRFQGGAQVVDPDRALQDTLKAIAELKAKKMDTRFLEEEAQAYQAMIYANAGPERDLSMTPAESMLFGSPDSQYLYAKQEVEDYYGKKNLNYDHLKDYIRRKIAAVTRTENGTYTHESIQSIVAIKNLLNSNEMKDSKVWNLTSAQQGELIVTVMGFLAYYDYAIVARNANPEQLFGAAIRTGGFENLASAFRFENTLQLRVRGSENPVEVTMNAGEVYNLMSTEYWAERALSGARDVRDEAARNMALYTLAKKLPGWNEALTLDSDGNVDFSKLEINYNEERKSFLIKMGVGPRKNEVEILGYVDLRRESRRDKEFKPVNRNASDLSSEIVGMGYFAQYMHKANKRTAMYDLQHKGDVNDAVYKYLAHRYYAKYNNVSNMDLMFACSALRADPMSMNFYKFLGPLGKELQRANGNDPELKEEVVMFLDYLFKNQQNWVMSKEQMLKRWKSLVEDRKVHDDVGNYVDRYGYIHDEHTRHDVHELMHKFIDKGEDFNWAPFLKMMLGTKEIPPGLKTKGLAGLKEVVKHWDEANLINAPFSDNWRDTIPMDERGMYADDFWKDADYHMRESKGYAARAAWAEDPNNWEAYVAMMKGGSYDWLSEELRGEINLRIQWARNRFNRAQAVNDQLKIEPHRRFIEIFDPSKHGNPDGVAGRGPRMGVNEEGVQLYEREVFYNESQGRSKGFRFPSFADKEWIEQIRKRQWMSMHQEHQAIRETLEHIGGWHPNWKIKIPKWGEVDLWGGDPFGYLEKGKWRMFSNKLRLGIGPTIAWFRVWWSSMDKREWLEKTVEEELEIVSHEMKKSMDGGGGH